MFRKQHKVDDEFYVTVARVIDGIFRQQLHCRPELAITKYRKTHPECTIATHTIDRLTRRMWKHIMNYPSLQALDEICQMGGFRLADVLKVSSIDEVCKFLPPHPDFNKLRVVKPDWEKWDRENFL